MEAAKCWEPIRLREVGGGKGADAQGVSGARPVSCSVPAAAGSATHELPPVSNFQRRQGKGACTAAKLGGGANSKRLQRHQSFLLSCHESLAALPATSEVSFRERTITSQTGGGGVSCTLGFCCIVGFAVSVSFGLEVYCGAPPPPHVVDPLSKACMKGLRIDSRGEGVGCPERNG